MLYGAALNQACTYASFDHLGIAQYLTRLGLALGDVDALKAGKASWEKDAEWQPLRQFVEETLVTRDVMDIVRGPELCFGWFAIPIGIQRSRGWCLGC